MRKDVSSLMEWGRLLIIAMILSVIGPGKTMGQEYVKQILDDNLISKSALAWPLGEDHYYLFRTFPDPDSFNTYNKQNHLQIIEYDHCGIVDAREIYFGGIWSIDLLGKIYQERDTLRIPVHISPIEHGNHREIGLLSLHKESLEGEYRYLQALNVIYGMDFVKFTEDFYLALGLVSYIDRPTQEVIFRLDREFNVLDYYQYHQQATVAGGIQIANNQVYIFSNDLIIKLNSNLHPQWTKAISDHTYIYQAIPNESGFIMVVKREYPQSDFFLVAVDFDGNFLWQSKDLALKDFGYRFKGIPLDESGNALLLLEQVDQNYNPVDLILTKMDVSNGDILEQWKINPGEERYTSEHFEMFGNEALMVIQDAFYNYEVIRTNPYKDELCPWESITAYDDIAEFAIWDTTNQAHKTAPFVTGRLIVPEAKQADLPTINILCQEEIPDFDLLPEQTVLCGEQGLEADLRSIPFRIEWSDGSQEVIRDIQEPGIYEYTYEVCDEYYGEQVEVASEPCPCDWYIPNVFHPGLDSDNGYYYLGHSCSELLDFEIQIFNRWGGLMFQSIDPLFRWDGRWKGKPLQSGVYTYLLYYEDAQRPGQRERLQGSLVMLH